MKNIKKLLFKDTKRFLTYFLISLVIGDGSLLLLLKFVIYPMNNEGLNFAVPLLCGAMLFGLNILYFYTFIGSFQRYRRSLKYYIQRTQEENFQPDEEEEFEQIGKKLYLSKNVIIHSSCDSFVLNRNWISSCTKDVLDIYGLNQKLANAILIKTVDQEFRLSFFSIDERDSIYSILLSELHLQNYDQTSEKSESLNQTKSTLNHIKTVVDQDNNSAKFFIWIGVLVLFALIILGFTLLKMKDTSSLKVTPIETTYENVSYYLKNKNYDGSQNIDVTIYETDEGKIVLYVLNNNKYAFKGSIKVTSETETTVLYTPWIRPFGNTVLFWNEEFEPTNYEIVNEQYKEMKDPSTVTILLETSLLTNEYGFNIIFTDKELNEEDVFQVTFEQAVYTTLEDQDNAILYFHDLSQEDFLNYDTTVDFSSVRYLSEIDAISKSIVIYSINNQERTELISFEY